MQEREFRLDELVERLADLERIDAEGIRLTDVEPERESWLSENLRLLSVIGSLGPGELGLGSGAPALAWGPLHIHGPLRADDDEIFVARETEARLDCWLRLLPPARWDPVRGREDLEGEAAVLRDLDHAGLARVRGAGSHEGRTGIWIEAPTGTLLADRLGVVWSWPEACDLVVAVGEVVAALHAKGLVHRRIEPDRIVLGDDGPVFVDLGPRRPSTDDGTAPEVMRGAAATIRADVYALGFLLGRLVGVDPTTIGALETLVHEEPDHRVATVDQAIARLRALRDQPALARRRDRRGWRRLFRGKNS